MDGSRNPAIDYQAAADACLVALSSIAVKLVVPPSGGGPSGAGALTGRTVQEPGTNNQEPVSPRPVSAVRLCKVIFPWETRKLWTHETQRRRVREAVVVARQFIAQRGEALVITGNWAGYWAEQDPKAMAQYAARRRRQGLRHLAAGSQAKRTIAEVGQQDLFPPPIPRSEFRH